MLKLNTPFKVFSTCPQSKDFPSEDYRNQVANVARWSEDAGCTGMLVYTDNGIVDPWLVAQIVVESTTRLCPLVAIQPVYMHPYAVAKMIATFGFAYGRQLYMNMVAGGFKNDLLALNDRTPHDRRYDRLTEYTTIVTELLKANANVSFVGEFYSVDKLRMTPALPAELFPGVFMSGSSASGLAAARKLGATAIQYPKRPDDYEREPLDPGLDSGIRIGIVARNSEEEAWQCARERFPEDRKGQLTHQLAMKVSDSKWHQQLSDLAREAKGDNPYWLVPFENYKTNCPYLVGSYERVAREVLRYKRVGYSTVILDIPETKEELDHINTVFRLAEDMSSS